MKIEINTKIKVKVLNGDVLTGIYNGIDSNGILLKNAIVTYKDVDGTSKLNMIEAHIDFNKIKDLFEVIK